jgi:hypothetical protein
MHACTKCINACIHSYSYAHIHTNMHIFMYRHMPSVMRKHTHTHTHTHSDLSLDGTKLNGIPDSLFSGLWPVAFDHGVRIYSASWGWSRNAYTIRECHSLWEARRRQQTQHVWVYLLQMHSKSILNSLHYRTVITNIVPICFPCIETSRTSVCTCICLSCMRSMCLVIGSGPLSRVFLVLFCSRVAAAT